MGCWNETCMISNLPIEYQTPIKLVFLVNGTGIDQKILNKSSYCNPTDLLQPAFLAISGTYDEYGTIANINEDWNYNLILKFFKNLCGVTITINGIDMVDWSLLNIIEGIERGNITYQNKPLNHSFVMIRQDIWDSCVLINSENGEFYNQEQNYRDLVNGNTWGTIYFDAFLETRRELIKYKLNDDDSGDEALFKLKAMMAIQKKSKIYEGTIFLHNSVNRKYVSSNEYTTLVDDYITNDEVLLQIKNQWFENQMINECLSSLRKGWIIQSGAGSQNADWLINLELSKTIIKICEKGVADNEEYDSDEI